MGLPVLMIAEYRGYFVGSFDLILLRNRLPIIRMNFPVFELICGEPLRHQLFGKF